MKSTPLEGIITLERVWLEEHGRIPSPKSQLQI
jgi:hypothetical protein